MHWYTQEGDSCYEVQKADNSGTRATTLRDARKLKLVPSVTTILQTVAKPGLERWKQDQILEAVLKSGLSLANKDVNQWKGMIVGMSKEQGDRAAKRGTEIHDKLEAYYIGEGIDEKEKEFILPVIDKLVEYGSHFVPELSFSHPKGYGGKVDLSSKKEKIIIDFKTKAKTDFSKPLAFDDHCMQLAAYREGLNLSNARCLNVFISTEEPGLIKVHEWSTEELDRGLEMFHVLLRFWQLQNNYNSSY